MTEKNKLYFADCLEILKKIAIENPQGIFDLIYIDPPFNSKRTYNVFFESADKPEATAQKEIFKDTWSNVSYLDTIKEIQNLSLDLYDYLEVLNKINISQSAVSYLTIMAIRIYYIHKVIKDTGSFYLHCDPNMSHYLKAVCDLIFKYENFINEIVWCYKSGGATKRKFAKKHDVILFYSKNDTLRKFNSQKEKSYMKHKYGFKKSNFSEDEKGQYSHVIMKDWWEISSIGSADKERLGYPTQKPETLMERIIKASSNEGDLVGDFFCGCGTTVAIAERLKRRWLGVDISHLAIGLIRKRLIDPYRDYPQKQKEILDNIQIDGFPLDLASAKELARNVDKGRLLFQDWIIEGMLGGVSNPKKTADGGYDGHISFILNKENQQVLIEVKSGKVLGVENMRAFIHVVKKRKAAIGVFVCFAEHVTKGMEKEVKECEYYNEELFNKRHPKIQILTVEQILKGESISMPFTLNTTFKSAARAKLEPDGEQKQF